MSEIKGRKKDHSSNIVQAIDIEAVVYTLVKATLMSTNGKLTKTFAIKTKL